jgi:hypothetical protein
MINLLKQRIILLYHVLKIFTGFEVILKSNFSNVPFQSSGVSVKVVGIHFWSYALRFYLSIQLRFYI